MGWARATLQTQTATAAAARHCGGGMMEKERGGVGWGIVNVIVVVNVIMLFL